MIIVGVLVIGALVALYFVIASGSIPFFRSFIHKNKQQEPFLGRIVPDGSLLYHTPAYHFSLLYPDNLTVHSFGEGGGASTITFENTATGYGFQIFVLPYTEATISDERFIKDNPIGVREDLQEGLIDGVTAAFFLSKNAGMGPSREVWFINKGYLYEATAPAVIDPWFLSIMTTWKFY